jgi:methylglutaconyl-CoA hydratase
MGVSALSELSIDAVNWKTAYWAKEKGLFARVFENTREMDKAIETLAYKLASYNSEALKEWKNTLWKNTEHWDQLLIENAEISGKLVLSDFSKKALENFKNK